MRRYSPTEHGPPYETPRLGQTSKSKSDAVPNWQALLLWSVAGLLAISAFTGLLVMGQRLVP